MDITTFITCSWCALTVAVALYDIFKICSADEDTLLSNRQRFEVYSTYLSIGGVLGTFIGITWGLYDFDSENLDSSVPKLLDGLKFAFLTSIFGMGWSYAVNKVTVRKYNAYGETDIAAAALSLSRTVSELKGSIEQNNTKILQSAMIQITNTFKTEMGKVSTELQGLMKKLVDKNFEELNTSINNLNKWQQDNKEMIANLISQYNTAVKTFEDSSTALSGMTASTKELVGEEGELTKLIDNLHTAMVDDENFVEISNNLTTAAANLKQNSTDWETSLKDLKQWVESQKGLTQNVGTLIVKLEDITKQKDFDTEFWASTRKGMNEATTIISNASTKLKQDLGYLNGQFYDRLNETLSALDDCIKGFMKIKK